MILVDANLLVYAYIIESPHHTAAKSWLEKCLTGPDDVGIPWASLLAFVRISANKKIFEHPATIVDAWKQAEEWLSLETVWVPEPTEMHRELLRHLLTRVGDDVNMIPDVHLAALAIEHDLTLCSTDGDFASFDNLRWENPLKPKAHKSLP